MGSLTEIFTEIKKKLSSEDKSDISSFFQELKSTSDDSPIIELLGTLDNKIEQLKRSDDKYQRALVILCKALDFEILSSEIVDNKLLKVINIGLAYLCDPSDIIPDYNPEAGYLDDLYMFMLVFRDVKKIDEDIHNRIFAKYNDLAKKS